MSGNPAARFVDSEGSAQQSNRYKKFKAYCTAKLHCIHTLLNAYITLSRPIKLIVYSMQTCNIPIVILFLQLLVVSNTCLIMLFQPPVENSGFYFVVRWGGGLLFVFLRVWNIPALPRNIKHYKKFFLTVRLYYTG